jgi:thiol-disulfide isomerase/thioredoxin
LALGLLLLQANFLRKFVIPATLLMLVVFTTHLSIVTFQDGGNSGNCGCFGSLLPMTPIEAIIKNLVAIVLLVVLLFIIPKTNENKGNFWILTTVTLASILMLYMLAPIQPKTNYVINNEPETTETIVSETTDTTATIVTIDTIKKVEELKKVDVVVVDEPAKRKSGYAKYFSKIDTGRKTLCFFVPGCDHCRIAAKELTELKQKDKNFPDINIIFMNEEADLIPEFFKFAGAEYPYTIIEVIPFWTVLGSGKDTPGVKYLWNGNEFKYYYGITDNQFNAVEFHKIVQKPYSELKK